MTDTARILLNSIGLLVFGSVLSFVAAWYWFSRNRAIALAAEIALEHAKTLARVTELEKKVAMVDAAIIPFNTLFQTILIKELTHAHTPEMDALMVKLGPPNLLTDEEDARLAVMLQERYSEPDPLISDAERDAAFILPAIMRRARAETAILDDAEALKLKLVTVAAVVGVPSVKDL